MQTFFKICSFTLCLALAVFVLPACSGQKTESEEQKTQNSASLAPKKEQQTGSLPANGQGGAGAENVEEGLLVGNLAPDFVLALKGGGEVKLSELRGKPVFLNISTTWCGPCQKEFPEVEKILQKYGEEMHIFVVSAGETVEDVDAYFNEKPYTFPIAYDPKGEMSNAYNVQFIPQSYFIDASGVITEYIPGASTFESMSEIIQKMI